MPIVLATVNAVVIAADAVVDNGYYANIEVSTSVQFIKEENKLVVNGNGTVSMAHSIAAVLRFAQGDPAANTPVTQEVLDVSIKRAGLIVVINTILKLTAAANLVIRHRSSDVLTVDQYYERAGGVANVAEVDAFAVRLLTYFRTHERDLMESASSSRFVLYCLVANAIHRLTVDGHNWITADTNSPNTQANRILGLAGADKALFGAFMILHGHDLWHFLSDETLSTLASALTGHVPAMVTRNIIYNQLDRNGYHVHTFMNLPEAVTVRYPPGNMGKAGTILGTELIIAVITDMLTKLNISNAADLTVMLVEIKDYLAKVTTTLDQIRAIKECLAELIAWAFGYCEATAALENLVKSHESLRAFASRHVTSVASGAVIAKLVRTLVSDPEAVSNSINYAMANLTNVLIRGAVVINSDTEIAEAEKIVLRPDEAEIRISNAERMARTDFVELAIKATAANVDINELMNNYDAR